MRNEHFQVNRPVGTGHSRAGDVIRIRKALRETGHGSSPPEPSGTYDASAIAAIERFQRDFGLKEDGVILPEGPTERLLDAALAVRRTGGAEAQDALRDVFQVLAKAELHFRPAPPDSGEADTFVDDAGESVAPERLRKILQNAPDVAPIRTAMMRREDFFKKPGQDILGAGSGGGGAAVPWGVILRGLLGDIMGNEPPKKGEENKPQTPGSEAKSVPDKLGKPTPDKTTVPVDIDTRTPPFAPEVPDFEQRDVPPPPQPRFPPTLPGGKIEEARPRILIFPDHTGLLDDVNIVEHRGNENTRKGLEWVRDYVWEHILGSDPNWVHKRGGRDKKSGEEIPEFWIPGPQKAMEEVLGEKVDGRQGGKFVDLTFENTETGEVLHVQTVDLDKNGKATKREIDNAEVILKATKNGWVLLFGKGKIPR